MKYNYEAVEKKWQKRWEESRIFEAKADRRRKKFFSTVAWPYPSGAMHVGHARTYTLPDVISRFKRMKGFNVLFPMGWHLTGSPIIGACQRIRNNDEIMINVLKNVFRVKEEDIEKLKDPIDFANYWINESSVGYKIGMKKLGYSIDWSRECTSIDPQFSKMIEWQYRKFKEKNLITKGTHPVKFCPNDNNPVTDHDLLEGEGVAIMEFTLVKYRMSDDKGTLFFPASTLRPETIFGVTNIWLHPDGRYVEIMINGERWVVSKSAAEKLKFQGKKFKVVEEFKGDKYIGKYVYVPYTDARVPILPATFVDVNHTSGVVGSVPAHAPFDYVALLNLQKNDDLLKKYNLNADEIKSIEVIHMIDLEGYASAGVDVVNKMGIKSQHEKEKLDEATQLVYKLEFARGKMASNCDRWSGWKVSDAKDAVKEELISMGFGDIMYEFSDSPVICRCGAKCVIKIVEDQWFLRYSDEEWKEKVRRHLNRMNLIPPETITYFKNVVDWLRDWPCTRNVGLGTRLPWDKEWIIESLSDSTIYMAYYTLARIMKDIDAEKITDEVFDYIFLGRGIAEEICSKTGIDAEKLKEMRDEFTYWHPQDYRISANELIPNHLTFMIFHHLALLPEEYCPSGIASLGIGILEGCRMSSSKGIVFAVADAVDKYGADVTRFYLMYMCEPWQDFDWRGVHAEGIKRHLERFRALVMNIIEMDEGEEKEIDKWLLTRINRHVGVVNDSLEKLQTRKGIQTAFFMILKDIRWYIRRGGNNKKVLLDVLNIWVRLLAPFIPHMCEEIWEMMGNDGFISLTEYPERDDKKMDATSEAKEMYLENLMEDIDEIMKASKISPRMIFIYTSYLWKKEIMKMAIERRKKEYVKLGDFMKEVMQIEEFRKKGKYVAEYVKRVVNSVNKADSNLLELMETDFDEYEFLLECKEFLEKEYDAKIEIYKSDDDVYDPMNKRKNAMPMKPAIYIE